MSRICKFIAAGVAIATFSGAVAASTPAAARRHNSYPNCCNRIAPPVAPGPVDLPLDTFIAAPAAPYSYYYAYPAPYPYIYARHGCIVRSGVYDGFGYFKGYQVLRVAC